MADLETIVDAVRARLGCSEVISPEPLAALLGLSLKPVSFAERPGLYGRVILFCDTVPPELQHYQQARGCAAHVLAYMRELRSGVSVHELAVALCGVSSADAQLHRESVAYTYELVHVTLGLVR